MKILDLYWKSYRSSALTVLIFLSYAVFHKKEFLSKAVRQQPELMALIEAYADVGTKIQDTSPNESSYTKIASDFLEDLESKFGAHQELFILVAAFSFTLSTALGSERRFEKQLLLGELAQRACEAVETGAVRNEEYMTAYPVLSAIKMRIEASGQTVPEVDTLVNLVEAMFDDANVDIPTEAMKLIQGLVR